MPVFEYEAINNEGKVVRAEIQARSTDDAMTKIREVNLYPTRLKEKAVGKGAPRAELGRRVRKRKFVMGGVRGKQLTLFTRQLSTLTDAGIPVVQSLDILEQQMRPCALKYIVGSVANDVESGSSLSEAMANYPKAFDNLFVNMVKAGETGGVLDEVLQRLAEFRERSARLKRRVVGALIYPLTVITFAIGILTLIVLYVIPKFTSMFEELDVELPGPTKLMLFISHNAVEYWYLLPVLPVGVYVMYRVIRATKTGRYVSDWLKFRIPLFGTVVNKSAIARFTRTFGTLVGSGVPILQALNISRDTAGNAVVADAISNVHDSIREGNPIAAPLSESKICDAMVVNMIDVGEETGNLDTMLLKIADNYDEEVDVAVEGLTSAMEPIMVVALGVIIGFIVISLFLPLVKLMNKLS